MWRAMKIFLLLALVAGIAAGASGNLGAVRVVWFGYLFETSVPIAAALFWALAQMLILFARALLYPFGKKRESDD